MLDPPTPKLPEGMSTVPNILPGSCKLCFSSRTSAALRYPSIVLDTCSSGVTRSIKFHPSLLHAHIASHCIMLENKMARHIASCEDEKRSRQTPKQSADEKGLIFQTRKGLFSARTLTSRRELDRSSLTGCEDAAPGVRDRSRRNKTPKNKEWLDVLEWDVHEKNFS